MKFYHVIKIEDPVAPDDKFIYVFSGNENDLKNRVNVITALASFGGDLNRYIDDTNAHDGVYYVSSYSDLNATFYDMDDDDDLQVMIVSEDYGETVAVIIHKFDDDNAIECDLSALEDI